MKPFFRSRTVCAVSCLLLLPALALPFLAPTFVIDITQELHSYGQLIYEASMAATAIRTYNEIVTMYNQIAYSAGWAPVRIQWLGVGSQVTPSATPNVFGETGTWNEAVNLGLDIPGAYAVAMYQMAPSPLYAGYPLGGSLMSATIASVNVADGSNPAAMMAIAQSRANQPTNDFALSQLEKTSQDITANTNSEVEQLNLENGSLVLLNRQIEDLAAVQTTSAEQQIVANKVTRDNLADAVNFFSLQDQTVVSQPVAWGNSAQTIMDW